MTLVEGEPETPYQTVENAKATNESLDGGVKPVNTPSHRVLLDDVPVDHIVNFYKFVGLA